MAAYDVPNYDQSGYSPVQTTGTFSTDSSGSSWWDANGGSVIGGVTSLANSLLGFGANIYAINHGQTPTDSTGAPIIIPQQAPQQPAQNNNTVLYIVLAVIVLLLVLGAAYFLKK
jgi:ABC-type molybdate transport system permease subunit